jgi:four helix bundle protein
MTSKELSARTETFAANVVTLTEPLLERLASREFGLQLRSAAASVASNYDASQRAKSHRDFTAKLTTVLEESSESLFWLRFLRRCGMITDAAAEPMIAEGDQLVRIFQTAVRTARAKDDADSQPPSNRDGLRRRHPRR